MIETIYGNLTSALIVAPPWKKLIRDGLKTWEMSTRPLRKPGQVRWANI